MAVATKSDAHPNLKRRDASDASMATWRQHPVMADFLRKSGAVRARSDAFEVLCSKATERSGVLASSLPPEMLEAILLASGGQCATDPIKPPRGYQERKRKAEGEALARRTLLASMLVCRSWLGPSRRLVRQLPVRVTTQNHCEHVLRSLTRLEDRPWGPTTLEIAPPSPWYGWDEFIGCPCGPCESGCDKCDAGEDHYELSMTEYSDCGHLTHCEVLASGSGRLPSPRQVARLVYLRNVRAELVRLVLTDVQLGLFTPDEQALRCLQDLKAIEDFSATTYIDIESNLFPRLFSAWPRLASVHLEELLGNDSKHDVDCGVAFPYPDKARYRPRPLRPLPGHLRRPRLRHLAINFTWWIDGGNIDRLLDPASSRLESLALLSPLDEHSRSNSVGCGFTHGVGGLGVELCEQLRCLELDANLVQTNLGPSRFLPWSPEAFPRWLRLCSKLSKLTLGPSPRLTEDLLAAIPASVERMVYVFEHSEEPVPVANVNGPEEAAELLCGSHCWPGARWL